MNADAGTLDRALRLLDDAWAEVRRGAYVQHQLGEISGRLPDVSFAEAERRSDAGRAFLARLDSLDPAGLPHDVLLSLRVVRFRAGFWAREAQWYWLVTDPLGIGHFGEFLPAAYCGGFLLNLVHGSLASFRFREPADLDRYLALVADYARLLGQFSDRTESQAERGIRMPKVQVTQARAMLTGFKTGARNAIAVDAQRLSAIESASAAEFGRQVEQRISTQVMPAYDRALAGLSEDYFARAPEAVGLGQYTGGSEVYRELVRLHTTLDLSPERVHEYGVARLREKEDSMAEIRKGLGFKGGAGGFLAYLHQNPKWRASTEEEITATFQRCIERLKPHYGDYFSMAPSASYGVAPLPAALRGSMTFGYYEAPRRGHSEGVYFFNPGNLTQQPLIHIAALTYHELMPGHHLQEGIQQENVAVHPLRIYNFVTAHCEGWAEYAATLAGEIGLYEEPEERYGRLLFDAFLTCRLIVDTGMNALGWSLERAKAFMREHSGRTEAEIHSETLRYSCDLPAQVLAYKFGDAHILAMRESMRRVLGSRFSIKDFHAAILLQGSLALPDLEWHVAHETARLGGTLVS